MSGTTKTPVGLDTMSAEDNALLDSMREDGPEIEVSTREPEAAPEAVEHDLDDAADVAETHDDGRPNSVPHKQFHAMRERAKAQVAAAEAKAAAAEQRVAVELARAQTRLDMLTQAVTAASAPPAVAAAAEVEIPDVGTDPIGHFRALHERSQRQIADQAAILNGFQEQQQRAAAASELRNWGVSQESEFAAREPAYAEAMEFLKTGRHAELEAAGVMSAADRDRIIAGDVTQIAMASRKEGVNFAERLYNVSVKRGFAKKAAAPVIPPLDAAPTDRVTRVQAGRENSTTIGTAGNAPPATLSPERIANMSESQFSALLAKMKGNPAALRDLMGH